MARVLTTTTGKPPPAVLLWRYHTLVDAGYVVDDALVLAERADVDLHLAVELLEQGCSAKRALRILL